MLTGVSGSSENRFNLSSLLAERIPSSVSEIYCYGRDEADRTTWWLWIMIPVKTEKFSRLFCSNGFKVAFFFKQVRLCLHSVFQNALRASLRSTETWRMHFLPHEIFAKLTFWMSKSQHCLDPCLHWHSQSYSFLSFAEALLRFLASYLRQLLMEVWKCLTGMHISRLSLCLCILMQNSAP